MTTPCCGTPVQCEHPDTECLIRSAHARQTAEKPLYHPLASAEVPAKVAEVRAKGGYTGKDADGNWVVQNDDCSYTTLKDSPLSTQVGGSHYKTMKIQPVQYIHANGLGFCEGSVVKYITRWKSKGGVKDLEKAKHFIDLLIELETRT